MPWLGGGGGGGIGRALLLAEMYYVAHSENE